MKKQLLLSIFLLSCLINYSQTTYTFIGNGNWSVASNWSSQLVPPAVLPAGAGIYISPINGGVCVLSTPQTISPGASLVVSPGANFVVTGNLIISKSYIYQVYSIYLGGSSPDTFSVSTYTYDSQHRVVSIVNMPRDTTYMNKPAYQFYYYNNLDSFPYKSVEAHRVLDFFTGGYTKDTTTTFHYYDNSGRNLKDSSVRVVVYNGVSSYYLVHDYSYGSSTIYCHQTCQPLNAQSNGFGVPEALDTLSLDGNGNILSAKFYTYDTVTHTWSLSAISNFTYDAAVCPFSELSNFKTYGVIPNGSTMYTELFQHNNRFTQQETYGLNRGTPQNYFYAYINTYNPAGLLTEVLQKNTETNLMKYKYILVYR